MGQFQFNLNWFEDQNFHLSPQTIVGIRGGRIGIGCFVMLECSATGRFLLGRKSFRENFDNSQKFTFPGGMVRTKTLKEGSFSDWVSQSMRVRHRAEMGIDTDLLESVAPQDVLPPYILSLIHI